MNRRRFLRHAVTLGLGAASTTIPVRVVDVESHDVPAYLRPVDPSLVFCEACRFDLFPRPRNERVCQGHYGAQFDDFYCEVWINGQREHWVYEVIAGENGVAWVEATVDGDFLCPCGANAIGQRIVRGHVEVRKAL